MDAMQIENELRDILSRRVPNTNNQTITKETEIVKLGIDSLTYSWILADIEDTFGFVMMGSEIMKLRTLQDVIGFVEARLE